MTPHTRWALRHLTPIPIVAAALLALPPTLPAATHDPESSHAASPRRAEIEAVLSSMKAAVLAADTAAYLALVIPGEGPAANPVFRMEQVNWAKDLADHAPASFELAISESPEHEPTFTDDRAEVELVMTWRPGEDANRPGRQRQRTVRFPALFLRVPAADGPATWKYAGERWVTVEGPPEAGVVARCYDGFEKMARDAVDVFPDVRRHVEDEFEQPIPHRQEIKIYPSMAHLQASIYLSYVDPLSGWNEPGESIKLLGSRSGRSSKRDLRPLLAHEFGHVATFEYGPRATDMPWWILEGVAEFAAQPYAPGTEKLSTSMARRWARGEGPGLAPWEAITDFRSTAPTWQGHVYRQGQQMIGYITTRFGRTMRNAWLRAMAGGSSLDDATRQTLGMSFADLDKAWRESLTDEPAAPSPPPAPDELGPSSP
ncbi:MAG: hypothetical protein KF745_07560 [Phycisphaeraceae bacterium]|nr:hypothetical protein [Phycisphaeraceae bacterium]